MPLFQPTKGRFALKFPFKELRIPRGRPSVRRQALVGERSSGHHVETEVKTYHRVSTYNPAIDRVVAELGERFNEDDQDILTSLGKVVCEKDPGEASFKTVAKHSSLGISHF